VPLYLIETLSKKYEAFPVKRLKKAGSNIVCLTPEKHRSVHEILYQRDKNYNDYLSVNFACNKSKNEIDPQMLDLISRKGREIQQKTGVGFYNRDVQAGLNAQAWQNREKMMAIVTENGRKKNREGKALGGTHINSVKAGTKGGSCKHTKQNRKRTRTLCFCV
jgi:hypothetical protein